MRTWRVKSDFDLLKAFVDRQQLQVWNYLQMEKKQCTRAHRVLSYIPSNIGFVLQGDSLWHKLLYEPSSCCWSHLKYMCPLYEQNVIRSPQYINGVTMCTMENKVQGSSNRYLHTRNVDVLDNEDVDLFKTLDNISITSRYMNKMSSTLLNTSMV